MQDDKCEHCLSKNIIFMEWNAKASVYECEDCDELTVFE